MPLAALVLAADQAEKVKPLTAGKLLIVIAILVVICFAMVLAGLGYFSPGND